jgi:DNA-binding CsgD family transcriptional regulator
MIIPAFAEVRQILVLTDNLVNFPFYLFVVYFLLRLIGPLINWHTHIQFDRKINFFNIIHLITYAVWAYTIYLIAEFYILSPDKSPQELIQQFKEPSLYSFSYPIIMLLHIGQAGLIIYRERKNNYPLANFMKFAVSSVLISLIVLQASYFVVSREAVELIVAPLIFIGVYFSLIVLNVNYANIFGEKVEKEFRPSIIMEELTERENEVLARIAMGHTDRQIAEELFISVHTVATYCRRIYSKLEVRNRTEAANLYNSRFN